MLVTMMFSLGYRKYALCLASREKRNRFDLKIYKILASVPLQFDSREMYSFLGVEAAEPSFCCAVVVFE